jgi:uncharacterized membrane protein
MPNAISRVTSALAASAILVALASPACAELSICNRLSYIAETAIGVEDRGAITTRGWFRVDPSQCRIVLNNTATPEMLFVHVAVPDVYGPSPLPQGGQAEYCVGTDTFTIANAQKCGRAGQKLARFVMARPSPTEKGARIYLAEDAEYSDEQARDAGIQRLLAIAGYDAGPIDGVRGTKTDAALAQFIADNKLGATAAARSDFFDILLDAAQKPGIGFTWCNETSNTVMAALGVDERSAIITRGWYRIAPGKCVRPDLRGPQPRVYSYGEAVDTEGQAIRTAQGLLSWGGSTMLCTRSVKFELSDQGECAARGLTPAGFAIVELPQGAATVRFK